MSCKFCSGEEALYDDMTNLSLKGDFYPGTKAWICDGTIDITSVADTYEPNFCEVSIPIKFCPVCGKRIKETGTL